MFIKDIPIPTEKERYAYSVQNSLNKAKHLSDRMRNFLADLEKSKLKKTDKDRIKNEVMRFLSELEIK